MAKTKLKARFITDIIKVLRTLRQNSTSSNRNMNWSNPTNVEPAYPFAGL